CDQARPQHKTSPSYYSPTKRSHHLFFSILRPPPRPTLFPYTTLFRSLRESQSSPPARRRRRSRFRARPLRRQRTRRRRAPGPLRSEEHTSELQSPYDLVCRLLLEKKKRYRKRATRAGVWFAERRARSR